MNSDTISLPPMRVIAPRTGQGADDVNRGDVLVAQEGETLNLEDSIRISVISIKLIFEA